MLQVAAEEFELRSQGLPGQLDCMRVRATSSVDAVFVMLPSRHRASLMITVWKMSWLAPVTLESMPAT